MEYNFTEIEKGSRAFWKENDVYRVSNDSDRPKYYILDMFPYPSGAGLHVGHPLGYIASDILARHKRMQGFNVLHPMGFDAFGLPAEQYALETGQHPAATTEENIARYKQQLQNIGFSFDWSRSYRTSDPHYYKWTQWIFLKLFKSWYNRQRQQAEPLETLLQEFDAHGNTHHPAPGNEELRFTSAEWREKTEIEKRQTLMAYRLAYLDHADVWWCDALGTVLANDEVVNGVSERGGHPVEKKRMRQWFLRITEFADRLLDGLNDLGWSDAMKEMQRNWIGRSEGAEVRFSVDAATPTEINVFTTRPDTIFGVDFLVLAPEHPLVSILTTPTQQPAVTDYVNYVKSRSERERMAEKRITGCFTGAYAIHPLSGKRLPVWIAEYVLAGYGTGAIMAVPSGDERDHAFATHFGISITNIFGDRYQGDAAIADKTAPLYHSEFLNGLQATEGIPLAIARLESAGAGTGKVNYKLRDAGFSRQRYWGEPFPIVYKDGIAYAIDEPELDLPTALQQLPVTLPHVDSYQPGPEGEGPLANIAEWTLIQNNKGDTLKRETNTMPGYAGSSWYFLRYMDPHNRNEFAGENATDYWQQVDLYIGGTEHAVGHLLYSRMWTKALHDLGYLRIDEPFQRLLNQGMIQGSSRFVYRVPGTQKFVSHGLIDQFPIVDKLHVDITAVDGVELNLEAFRQFRNGSYADATFLLENGKYICGVETEKMSKSKYNVVNPDDIVARYGADTFRMYEMFLGPIEISKPWDTKGIEGVHRFLKKFWRLFYSDAAPEAERNNWIVSETDASEKTRSILHKAIKKITEDTERFSFNTAVSQFMITVNALSDENCHEREILDPLVRLIAPYAPHVAEFLWQQLGHSGSVTTAPYPQFDAKYLVEHVKMYPVAINGKARTQMEFALDADPKDIEAAVLANEVVQKWMDDKPHKKFIYVKGRMINIVV